MAPEKTYSIYEIWKITRQIEPENFVLANAARMVYFAGFHKNEIENIKIKDAFRNNIISSIIEPFLKSTKKAYTKMPIILDPWPMRILGNHIKQLERGGYAIDDEAPLFPDPTTKNKYGTKKLYRHFNKYFEDTNFDGLRELGVKREKRRLKTIYGNSQNFKDELLKYSRHSRLSTTQQFIEREVQKAGKSKKKDLPWEIIVKRIERLPFLRKAPKNIYALAIGKIINDRIEEKDVKESLDALLNVYKQKLNIK